MSYQQVNSNKRHAFKMVRDYVHFLNTVWGRKYKNDFEAENVVSGWVNDTVRTDIGTPSKEMKACSPLIMCLFHLPVTSDAILLLLILHYNGSLKQSLLYTLLYPFITSNTIVFPL